jgi:hypothetical protein
MHSQSGGSAEKTIYVTRTGLPLSFKLEWPFHKSTSGADFYVLHTDIVLEDSPELHSRVAVNVSATVREVMASLEPKDAEGPVINSLRKEVDRHQLEFLKSGKLVPVNFSSRHWDFKRSKWVFGTATDEVIASLLVRKVYWQAKVAGGNAWLGDPTEAMYMETTVAQCLAIARKLEAQALIKLQGEHAEPAGALMAQAEKIEADRRAAEEELEKKHAFERG